MFVLRSTPENEDSRVNGSTGVVSVLFRELGIDRVPCPALNWLGK